MEEEPVTVAVINSTPDTIELLRDALFKAGYLVVSGFTHDIRDGKLDFEAFMRQHKPRVVLYDIAPPYDRNLRLFYHIRAMPISQTCHFVVTSTHPRRVTELIGHDEQVYEVVDRLDDLMRLIRAVKEATRARATR